MEDLTPRQIQGIKQGEIYKRRALENYYQNPNVCMNCGKVIEVPEGKRPSDISNNKFCGHSCSASHHNKGRDRWKSKRVLQQQRKSNVNRGKQTTCSPTAQCQECGETIILKKVRKNQHAYSNRKYCDVCLPKIKNKKSTESRLNNYGYQSWEKIAEMARDEVFSLVEKWQTARGAIRKNALQVYEESGRPYICKVCGYDYHVEISHIKDVMKDFNGTTLISVINHIDNLVALCPNHHKEFDDGHIQVTTH
jgi:hypothetical protein